MLTNNQFYAGQNRRFDKRAKLLRKCGFRYERIESLDIAVFTRNPRLLRKQQTIAASFLLCADRRAWGDKLAELLRRA
jgi:hypothetical protein